MEKIYLDENKKIWVIENFLTKEELEWLEKHTKDPNGWYPTMRSPYANILNKFLDIEAEYEDDGNIRFPDEHSKPVPVPIFYDKGGIWERLESVLPPGYRRHCTLQTFKYVTDEEIVLNLNHEFFDVADISKEDIDFAMYWHADPTEEDNILISFSLYLNDDFEGGELEFQNLPISVKPKAGMLVGIPGGKAYSHRVTKVLGPNNRHTLYGNSYVDPSLAVASTKYDC